MAILIGGGCGTRSAARQEQSIGVGRMDFHVPGGDLDGVVIGAPFGLTEPDAVDYATRISEKTGAGLVIAYGFKTKRVTVEQPLVVTAPLVAAARTFRSSGSVYSEYRDVLHVTAAGPLRFYVGLRVADEKLNLDRIEVATSGLTFEQLKALKQVYVRLRDHRLENSSVRKVDMALNPLDDVSFNVTGVKNHGVLMYAKRGIVLRMPYSLTRAPAKSVYVDIMTEWVREAIAAGTQGVNGLPSSQITLMRYGRMESLPERKSLRGIVIGAPHGSFDRHTAEFVEDLSYRTGLPAVSAKGFTPTEADGWRINVNRPTEKSYPMGGGGQEKNTDRARLVFQAFAKTVLQAARGPLDLYFDFHQNSQEPNIDVATAGITAPQAKAVKAAYQEIRDRWLANTNANRVGLMIEPIDKVTFRALVAKEQGMLRIAKRAFHFEMPAHRVFYDARTRHIYAAILAELIERIVALDLNAAGDAKSMANTNAEAK